MQGFAGGLLRAQSGLLLALHGIGQRVRQAGAGIAFGALAGPAVAIDTRPPVSVPRAAASIAGNTYHITVQVQPGAPAQALAQAVRATLEQFERDKQARTRSRLGGLRQLRCTALMDGVGNIRLLAADAGLPAAAAHQQLAPSDAMTPLPQSKPVR